MNNEEKLQLFNVWETIKTCVGALPRLSCNAKVILLELVPLVQALKHAPS